VEWDAQLARQADIAAMVRAGKCSCKECRQRRMIRCFSRLIEASAMDGLLQRLEDLRALLIEHELYLQAPSPAAPDAHAPPAAAASSAAPVKCARPPSPEVIVLDGLPGAALRRRRSFQLLEAPLNWPPGEADSVLLSNADLVRYVGTLRGGISQPALTPPALRGCSLKPNVYLNDQLIDLAMKLMVSQLPEALRVRMHLSCSVYVYSYMHNSLRRRIAATFLAPTSGGS